MTTLYDPAYGEMKDVYDSLYDPFHLWQIKRRVAGFGELVIQFDTTVSLTAAHRATLEHFLNNINHYKHQTLLALLEYYQQEIHLRRKNGVPVMLTARGLERLLKTPVLTIHQRENTLGLSYECFWDREQGAGVLFTGGQVEGVGVAEVALRVGNLSSSAPKCSTIRVYD